MVICADYHVNLKKNKSINLKVDEWHLIVLASMFWVSGEGWMCFPID